MEGGSMQYGGMVSVPVPASDEKIEVVVKKRKTEKFPGFTIFGNGKATRKGGKSMDILDICKQLNKTEMNLLQFFRDEVEYNKIRKEKNVNEVTPTRSELWTPYLATGLKKNYAHMECLGIIRRMKRGTYMINPNLLIPTEDVERHKIIWEDLEETCNDQSK